MENDLHWLGGIWDGEGCFAIVPVHKDSGTRSLAVQAKLVNTSLVVIGETQRILRENHVPFHVASRPITKGQRQIWHISMNGMLRTKRLLAVLRPYVRAKAQAADIVSDYIRSRLARPHNDSLTPHEVDLFFALRDLQGYAPRESSETLRSALLRKHVEKAMIKSDLRRNPESAGEIAAPSPKG